jgi:hypothetical protein
LQNAAIGWRRAQDVEARPTIEREVRSPMSPFSIRFELDERSRALREPAERVVDFPVSMFRHHEALTV